MDVAEMKNVLLRAATVQPGFIVDILSEQEPQSSSTATSPSLPWCICSNCKEMETDDERICCRKRECLSMHPVSNLTVQLLQIFVSLN